MSLGTVKLICIVLLMASIFTFPMTAATEDQCEDVLEYYQAALQLLELFRQSTDPIAIPVCDTLLVELLAETSRVKTGKSPQFSVLVSNNSDRSVTDAARIYRKPTLSYSSSGKVSPSKFQLQFQIPGQRRRLISLNFSQADR